MVHLFKSDFLRLFVHPVQFMHVIFERIPDVIDHFFSLRVNKKIIPT